MTIENETIDQEAQTADMEPQEQPNEAPQPSRLESMLDSLTEGAEHPAQETEPTEQEAQQPATLPQGQQATQEAKQPDDDAEIEAGLKERSRQRFQELKAQVSERDQRLQAYEGQVNEFRTAITDAGLDANGFAQMLQFAKLSNSNNPADLQVAQEMLTQQMAHISMRLGKEAPGIDLLKDFPDLKDEVENFRLSRERAVEIAKSRHMQAQQAAQYQREQQHVQLQQQSVADIQTAQQQMDAYFKTRENEVDHPAKLAALQQHFSNPANMQEFVSTYQPQQWLHALRLMYDGIRVQPPAPKAPQPLRSRAGSLGAPSAAAQNPMDRMAQRLESMGI